MLIPNSFDASFSHVPAAVVKAHGGIHVMGYLSEDTDKNMTSDELRAHHDDGLGVTLGWESDRGRPLLGAAAGELDATETLRQMRAHFHALGYRPRNRVSIPFACDQDVNPSQFPTILEYLLAAQQVFTNAGTRLDASMYGEFDLIEYLAAHGISRGLYQCYAWSEFQISRHASLYQFLNGQQIDGYDVDFDRVQNARTLGAWWPRGHTFPRPPKNPKEFKMDAQAKAAFAELGASIDALQHTLHIALTDHTKDGDGERHNIAAIVAHYTKGRPYAKRPLKKRP